MTNLIRLTPLFVLLTITMSGCYYDKENELYPLGSTCDTTGVMTYSKSIMPIMSANCNVCHSGANAQSGVITNNYEGLSIVAKNGTLLSAVEWTGPVHMPKGGNKLTDCDLKKIKKWVDSGSPDN